MTLPQQEDPMQQANAPTERRKHNNPHFQQQVRNQGEHASADGCLVCAPQSLERRVAAVTPGESKDPMPRFNEGRFSGFHEWHNALADWTLRQLQKIGDKSGFIATAFDCVEWAARDFYRRDTAWLVEDGSTPPKYATVPEWGGIMFDPDVNKAIRMSRREDAEMLAALLEEDAWRIAEHMWPESGQQSRENSSGK